MIELTGGRPAPSRSAGLSRSAPRGYREAWRRTMHRGWVLLNAAAMVDGRRGSLAGGAMTEDDRRLRARSRTGH